MYILNEKLKEWARIINDEIIQDDHAEWWHPYAKHGIFNQARMKFVNRNLNYFSLPNMVAHANEISPEYNPRFIKTRQFCEEMRYVNLETGPFGRMCVWKIPPGLKILPHRDAFGYHRHITRYIFIVSDHNTDVIATIDDSTINVSQGSFFNFYPAPQLHSFENNSNTNWYFLGFDYWKPDLLDRVTKIIDVDSVNKNPNRYDGFGIGDHKYQSSD